MNSANVVFSRRSEQGCRVSWFYVCNSLTQIFGGFVAYGVSFANTKFASMLLNPTIYVCVRSLTLEETKVESFDSIYSYPSPYGYIENFSQEEMSQLLTYVPT